MPKVIPITREDPAAHAKLAPSSAHRWIPCPGSVQAQAEHFDPLVDDSNEHSRLGTAAHALLESCLITSSNPQAFIGQHLAGKDHPAVDDDMCDWVQVALDYIEEYIDTYGEENLWVLPETRVYIGSQLAISGDDEQDDLLCNGTSDTIIAHKDMSMCVSIDYKNGIAKVDAKDNPQTMLYSVGARNRYGKFKRYRSVIIQPRAGKRSPVDEWECTDAHLMKWVTATVRPSARAALQPNAPRAAGAHCLYCDASARCRTRRDKARAVAGVEFDVIEEPDLERLTDEEFLQVLNGTAFLEGYIASVRGHALRMLEHDPRSVPGWKLGWAKRQRLWDNELAVIEYCEAQGIEREDYAPASLLTPAQLSKLLKRRMPRVRRKRGEPPAANPVDAFVTYSVPKIKLVPDDGTAASDEFDEVDE